MSDGNGHSIVPAGSIDLVQVAPDWLYLEAGAIKPSPEKLPLLLDRTLINWLHARPNCKIRAVLPIVQNGHTVAIHVWYDDASE